MSEFTGERVIPGQVEIDLWNEHFSRYAFAARFATGKRTLDLGCGSGYGSAALADTAESVIGIDLSADAIEYARRHYQKPNLSFFQHSCTQLPWPEAGYQLIVAFEVIEHLSNWREMLQEAKRLLTADGVFIVSTPNRLYYAEQRKLAGPNPFHEHEFEYEEFRSALKEFFPQVRLLVENRSESFVFAPGDGPGNVYLDGAAAFPEEAHFFVAVCGAGDSNASIAVSPFVYVPSAGNVLREREQHIERLTSELTLKDGWLQQTISERAQLQAAHDLTISELETRNRWARELEAELAETRTRVQQLQEELAREQEAGRGTAAAYETKIAELDRDIQEKTTWAIETEERLTAELQAKCGELAEAVRLLDQAESTVEDRTRWALQLDERARHAEAMIAMIRASRWVRLGRVAGLGPKLD